MIILKLAVRNLYGAGLRTWLNAVALSFAFVSIIFLQGLYDGMSEQVERSTIEAQYGGGQYWGDNYDPFDPLTLEDAHHKIPEDLKRLIAENKAVPMLIHRATIYPRGRFRNALLKGIPPEQTVLSLPTSVLTQNHDTLPALIGSRMSKSTGLKRGDVVTVRWRDANGTFDADEVSIVAVMHTDIPDIDNGQIWIPIEKMREMMLMPSEATLVVLAKGTHFNQPVEHFQYKDLNFLLRDLRALVLTKSIGGSIFYLLLLFLAMLAIFDTQILSIFRRRKEMGTLMALGMTRSALIRLFTLEGALHAVLSTIVGALYGTPLLLYMASTGYGLPEATDNFGIAIGNRIFPVFSCKLIIGTTLLVLVVTTIVSYLPSRRIATLAPADALKGKFS